MMKKQIYRAFSLVLTVALMTNLFCIQANAASATVTNLKGAIMYSVVISDTVSEQDVTSDGIDIEKLYEVQVGTTLTGYDEHDNPLSFSFLSATLDGNVIDYSAGETYYPEQNGPEVTADKPGLWVVTLYSFGAPVLFFALQVTGEAEETTPPAEPTTPAEGTAFSDVAADSYCYDAVLWAVEKSVTTGTTATTFSPNSTCTVAQILTFLWRASGSPEPSDSNPFTDVTADAYYYKAALWASENGLVSGTAFSGSTPCTRSQTVTYLWQLTDEPTADAAPFTDVADDASVLCAGCCLGG